MNIQNSDVVCDMFFLAIDWVSIVCDMFFFGHRLGI